MYMYMGMPCRKWQCAPPVAVTLGNSTVVWRMIGALPELVCIAKH